MPSPYKKDENPNGKHAGGRPSKYKPEYCQQLIDFISAGGREVYKPIVVSDGKAGSHVENHLLGRLPAFFQDFATSIDVTFETLHQWCRTIPEFSASYKKAKSIQESQMIQGGISGTYQQASLIFALKNLHGWRDQTNLNVNSTHTTNINVKVDAEDDELANDLLAKIRQRSTQPAN